MILIGPPLSAYLANILLIARCWTERWRRGPSELKECGKNARTFALGLSSSKRWERQNPQPELDPTRALAPSWDPPSWPAWPGRSRRPGQSGIAAQRRPRR